MTSFRREPPHQVQRKFCEPKKLSYPSLRNDKHDSDILFHKGLQKFIILKIQIKYIQLMEIRGFIHLKLIFKYSNNLQNSEGSAIICHK